MKLDVLIGGRLAGSLDLSNTARPVFSYDGSYLQQPDATPLSTRFPLDDLPVSDVSLRHWLMGMLPDDERVLRSLCEEHDVSGSDRLALLGTPMGVECAGAIQFCRPDVTEGLLDGEGGLRQLSDSEVVGWLRNLRNDPAYRPEPALVSSGFSLAGMQPKIALRRRDRKWHVPWGAEPSSHIIKVARSDTYAHEAVMEHLTMQTATRMGIMAAPTAVMCVEDVEAIIVTRYDRAPLGGSSLRRVHQEDFCQALGFSPDMKYQYQGGPTPDAIASVLGRVDRSDPTMREKFLDMLVFQWLIVGNDAHSKNYALLLSGGDCQIAPLYDACSWIPYRRGEPISRQRIAMKIGGDYRVSSADQPTAMIRTAKRLGLPEAATTERFESLAATMPDALADAINHLPESIADMPIIGNYAIEQPRRARQCEQIAHRASKMVHTHRSPYSQAEGSEEPSIAPVVQELPSQSRSAKSKRSRRSSGICGTPIGKNKVCNNPKPPVGGKCAAGHRRN